VPDKELPRDEEFEETSTQLSDGLKSCHAVVSGYRALLGSDQNDEAAPGETSGDEPRDGEGRAEGA
jgi:hypothetical protein